MTLRRALLLLLVAICAHNAFGHYYEGYEWHLSGRLPLVPVWHAVTSYQVHEICGGDRFNACAFFDTKGGVCNVYASQGEFETPTWLRWHELLHCAGWDHN